MALFARNQLDARAHLRTDFLHQTDWRGGVVTPLNADMGTRRYLRVEKNNKTAVLLESLPDGHADASPGHRLDDWVKVNKLLALHGLSVPEIYAQNLPLGYMLLEDWGDVTFTRALDEGQDAAALYSLATQAMKVLNSIPVPSNIDVPHFFESRLPKSARHLIDFYAPCVRGVQNESGLAEQFDQVLHEIYTTIMQNVGAPQLCFSHTDLHPGNMMLLQRPGVRACGILDFQNPMQAPVPYDFVNLLFDARRAPAQNIITLCRDLYCQDMNAAQKESFDLWGIYVAMLFHARVIGLFLRAGLRGNNFYAGFLPIVVGHFRQDLQHPILKPVADFLQHNKISLNLPNFINFDKLRELTGSDNV